MKTVDEILAGLGDESWRTRKDAVAAAASFDSAALVPRLIALLGADVEVAARNAAIEALSAIGEPAVPALAAVIESGAAERKFALDALAGNPSPARLGPIVAALADEDENVRAAAADALGEQPSAEALEALGRQLERGGPLGRLAALAALVRARARLPLQRALALLEDPILHPRALEAAGLSGDLEAIPHLLAALADPARGGRQSAMIGLVALHGVQPTSDGRARVEASVRAAPEAIAATIVAALAAPGPARRAASVLAGWGRWPEALPLLAEALLDDAMHEAATAAIAAQGPFAVAPLCALAASAPPSLRREIIAVLPRLGAAAADWRVADLCERALFDDDVRGAMAAAEALAEIGGKDAMPALLRALGHEDDEVILAAGAALARLARRYRDEARLLVGARALEGAAGAALIRVLGVVAHPGDRPRLLAALRAADPGLRRAAAAAVAQLGSARETVDALVFALADEDPGARAAAAEGLGALGARDAVPALEGACRDQHAAVAGAAARALGRLRDGRPALRALASHAEGALALPALEALALFDDPADDELFVAAAAHRDPEVVKAAIAALARRPRPACVEVVRRALEHPRWDVRLAAAQAAR